MSGHQLYPLEAHCLTLLHMEDTSDTCASACRPRLSPPVSAYLPSHKSEQLVEGGVTAEPPEPPPREPRRPHEGQGAPHTEWAAAPPPTLLQFGVWKILPLCRAPLTSMPFSALSALSSSCSVTWGCHI